MAKERWEYRIYPYAHKNLALPRELIADYENNVLYLRNEDNTKDIRLSSPELEAHRGLFNNPHRVTKTQIQLSNVDNTRQAKYSDYIRHISTMNPHNITLEDLDLELVENYKPATVDDMDNREEERFITAQQLKYYLEWYKYMVDTYNRIYLYTKPNTAKVEIFINNEWVDTKDTMVESDITYKYKVTLNGYFDINGTFNISKDTAIYVPMSSGTTYYRPKNDMIAINNNIAMALTSDRRIISWGSDVDKEITNTPAGSGYKQVASTKGYNVAISDTDHLIAWGPDNDMVSATPTGMRFKKISLYEKCGIGIDINDQLYTWGYRDAIIDNTPLGKFIDVSCGMYHASAIKEDGSVITWGDNNLGQSTNMPTDTGYVQIECGAAHTIARKQNNTVKVWGDTSFNQSVNVPTTGNIVDIASSAYYNMIILLDGTIRILNTSTALHLRRRTEKSYVYIKAYDACAVAITHDGSIVCFGNDNDKGIITSVPIEKDFKSW